MSQILSHDTLDNFIKRNKLADESLINFLKDARYTTKDLASYQQYLKDTGKATSTFATITKKAGAAIKSIGTTIASMGISMAIGMVFEAAIKEIDNFVHKAENAREALDEFYKETSSKKKDLDSQNKWIQENGKAYEDNTAKINIKKQQLPIKKY